MALPLSPRPLQCPFNKLKTPRKPLRTVLWTPIQILCPALDPQIVTPVSPRPPHGVPEASQTTRETSQPALTTKPQATSTGTPRSLKPLSRSTLDPHLAQGSSLEWGLLAVIPG